ncbi:MAG TPA: hypothetical protein VFI47_15040 [Acidimicrobiales bacterium]|nr:hypothetical protein [Acidimicrobiales bacterium]
MRARLLVPAYAALAGVVTWPLGLHLASRMAYGTEEVGTVPLFNLWTLRWNQARLGHLYRHYWDAPLFHPEPGAFALSEPQPLTGLVFAPLAAVTGNPVLAFNVVLLAAFTLNGLGAHRLARTLGAGPGPAAVTGALGVGLPFAAVQMGVLQLTMVFPLFFLVDAVVRWAPAGGRRRAAAAGLWLAVTVLTCGYYGLFAVVVVGPAAVLLVRRSWLSRRRLVDAAVAVGVFAVLAAPAVVGQASRTSGYSRSDEIIEALSAGQTDFWQLPVEAPGAGLMPWLHDLDGGQALYPGTVLLLLGVVGYAVGSHRWAAVGRDATRAPLPAGEASGDPAVTAGDPATRDPAVPAGDPAVTAGDPAVTAAGAGGGDVEPAGDGQRTGPDRVDRRRRLWFLLAGLVLARVLSLGLNLDLGGFRPYSVVRSVVPGFDSLRSPFRLDVLTQVFLVALATFAIDHLWRRASGHGRGPAARRAACGLVAVAVVGLAIAETGVMPVRLFRVADGTPDWAAWIADHPAAGDVLAYLPFPAEGRVEFYEPTVEHMLGVLDTEATTVNGYSGFFPASYDSLEGALRGYPNEDAESLLRRYGVTRLVVDQDWLAGNPGAAAAIDGRYRPVFTGDEVTVYARR